MAPRVTALASMQLTYMFYSVKGINNKVVFSLLAEEENSI